MDPLTHTLFGAALAETGLRRVSRHATAALLLGANLPDVDAVVYFWGSDAALHARRGWTHGLLSMAILPLLLVAALLLWSRWRKRHHPAACKPHHATAVPVRPLPLLAVACLGVWSHPLLDWLNTYGVRVLMPLDGQWFHGDTLFIADPWLWLLLAAGVLVARSAQAAAIAAWTVLAAAASWLVLTRGLPSGVVVAWCSGLLLLALLRWRVPRARAATVAQLGVLAALAYGTVMFGLARQAEARAVERFPDPLQAQASPLAARPLAHRVVLVWSDRYRVVSEDGSVQEYPRVPTDAVVRHALADPSIRGFAGWMRFPWWQVEQHASGWRVRLYDLRYAQPGSATGGIGYAEVVVPAAIDP